MSLLSSIGIERIFEHVLGLQDKLENRLVSLGWTSLRAQSRQNRSTILSFEPPAGVDLLSVQQALRERKVSVGIPNGRLRFGFHWFNTELEVDYVCDVMRELAQKPVSG